MEFQSALESTQQKMASFLKNTSNEMQTCIQNCLQCGQACEQLIQHCLGIGGAHSEIRHIRILQDCADICRVSAQFMIRQSDFHHRTCEICSEICLACAQDCESMKGDDMMQLCAEICRTCADSCQKMSTHQ